MKYYLYDIINQHLHDDGLELLDIQVKEIYNLVKVNPYIQMVWVASVLLIKNNKYLSQTC